VAGNGALNADAMDLLADFIRSVAEQDESLSNLSLVSLGPGSTEIGIMAKPPLGMPDLYTRRDQRRAIGDVFGRGRLGGDSGLSCPDKVLEPFRKRFTVAGPRAELFYRSSIRGRERKIAIDHKSLAKATQRPPKAMAKEWVSGRVERLAKDVKQFGISTSNALLHCPMDRRREEMYLDYYTRGVTVDVLATFPPKSKSKAWVAKEIHEIIPRPEPLPPIGAEDCTGFGIEDIPGIIVPKRPLTFGALIGKLAAGLTPEDADSLSDFLEEYRSL